MAVIHSLNLDPDMRQERGKGGDMNVASPLEMYFIRGKKGKGGGGGGVMGSDKGG